MTPPALPQRVAVTGATGLIGSAVCDYLARHGCEVIRMVRDPKLVDVENGYVYWSVEGGVIDIESLEGIDAVVHLAGRSVAKGRWTAKVKREIRESRLQGTALWGRMLAKMRCPPKVFVSASAVGYYGDTGGVVADESAEPGLNFLSKLAYDWEAEVAKFNVPGLRTVQLRLGVVLSRHGGALPEMMRIFRLGMGGPFGSGNQYFSWISLIDAVRAVSHVLKHESITGPVNLTAPDAVTNHELTLNLGRVLHRPTLFRMPGFMLRLVLGEMAEELLLVNCHVMPKRLSASGFTFNYPRLKSLLRREMMLSKGVKKIHETTVHGEGNWQRGAH